jgi:hypothetical protein
VLVALGYLSAESLARVLADQLGVELVSPGPVSETLLRRVPMSVAL